MFVALAKWGITRNMQNIKQNMLKDIGMSIRELGAYIVEEWLEILFITSLAYVPIARTLTGSENLKMKKGGVKNVRSKMHEMQKNSANKEWRKSSNKMY